MDNLLYIGYVSGPFGLKGELKIISDSNYLDKIFTIGHNLYIDGKAYKIINYHLHKNYHLITFKDYEDINKCDDLIKKDVYVSKNELNLKDDEFLYIELVGFEMIDNNKTVGVVEEILLNKKNVFIKSGNLIVPLVPKYFDHVSVAKKCIYIQNSEELFL